MRADIIVEHEHWQEKAYLRLIAEHFMRGGFGPLPTMDRVKGKLNAYINQGRWVVSCPHRDCGGAVCVSSDYPKFICTECGSPENAGNWYAVVFPKQKTAIEQVLLKRPARDGFRATDRNWYPKESLAKLKAENAARGID